MLLKKYYTLLIKCIKKNFNDFLINYKEDLILVNPKINIFFIFIPSCYIIYLYYFIYIILTNVNTSRGDDFMKNNQNSTRNINVAVEYFNNDNFESINLLKKIDSNKYSEILKPKVTLKVTGVFKKIKLNKMPVETGLDSFIVLNNNSIELYTSKIKNPIFFLGYKESILTSRTFIIKSLFNDESKVVKLKDYKLIKSFKIDDLYDLIFLIKLNNDYTVNSVYLHYGDVTKIYLNI